jgi:hypothetical protein
LLKLFRYLHESVHALSAENAHLKARLGEGSARALPDVPTVVERVTPSEADCVPPSELGKFYRGMRPGPDDPKPPVTIEGRAVPKPPTARPPQTWDDTAGGKAWQAWHDAGGSVGGDPWANNNR